MVFPKDKERLAAVIKVAIDDVRVRFNSSASVSMRLEMEGDPVEAEHLADRARGWCFVEARLDELLVEVQELKYDRADAQSVILEGYVRDGLSYPPVQRYVDAMRRPPRPRFHWQVKLDVGLKSDEDIAAAVGNAVRKSLGVPVEPSPMMRDALKIFAQCYAFVGSSGSAVTDATRLFVFGQAFNRCRELGIPDDTAHNADEIVRGMPEDARRKLAGWR